MVPQCRLVTLLACLASGWTASVPRAGFSAACRGHKSIGKMVSSAEVVVEAEVVKVTPPQDNIYAVTLQIKEVMKAKEEGYRARVGQRLQLLFIKPQSQTASSPLSGRRPDVRALPSARSYLEACIYELDLKPGKRYHLFLAAQPGQLSGRADLARFVMTGPPLLASKKSSKKILAATCEHCDAPPTVKSLKLIKSRDGRRLRLVCQLEEATRKSGPQPHISWTKDGQRLTSSGRRRVVQQQKRNRSVLLVRRVRLSDAGVYTCTAANSAGAHTATSRITVRRKPKTTTTTAAVSTTAVTATTVTSSAPTTTTSRTTTATTTPIPAAESVVESAPCPIQGFCLNGGTCSFIPWLGELSCACAPGFQGARCESKTTSALYSSLSMASTLCMFGLANPYHSC